MAFVNPTVDAFKTYFYRDFPYGSDPVTSITDTDIANAYQLTNATGMLQANFFKAQETYTLGYLYLSAHYLVLNIQTSALGISASASGGIETSKSVGSVSQGFQIPEAYANNPTLAALVSTKYGQQYFQMIYPQLVGPVVSVRGGTRP